jgi:dTDP-4-amino-4,6-dideoxygalactose transaminase
VIPLVDLQAQYRSIRTEIDAAVSRVLESGHYALGPEVAAFEREFGDYVGAPHAVAVNTGTSALHLILLGLGIGPGDEVITVPMTFIATAAAIHYTGATPRFVDVEPRFYTMDPARLEAAITRQTKAIMPVHLYGQMADMDPILAVAQAHGIPVVEDAAQAHGARDAAGRRAGTLGQAAAFSFYPGKNLGACGEGGLLVTADADLAARCRMLRDWGQARRYEHTVVGYNYRMDGIQGAVLRVKLAHLEQWTEARIRHAARYAEVLAGAGLDLPETRSGYRHVFHIYPVRTAAREALKARLLDAGIHAGIHYPIPVHLQPAFAHLGYRAGDFPVTEALAAEELSLPMFAELTNVQVETVAESLRAHVAAG